MRALLRVGYAAGRADALGLTSEIDPALTSWLAPLRPANAAPSPHPGLAIADLCAREHLPIPVGAAARLALRSYLAPSGTLAFWLVRNTGGGRHRFVAPGVSDVIERRTGSRREPVPATQMPQVVQALRAILATSQNPPPRV